MMKRADILMQSLMWAYNGLEITFWSGVYPTCIGQTKQLANRFGVVGLSGIIVGVGEIAGDYTRFSTAWKIFLGATISTLTGNTARPPRGPLGEVKITDLSIILYLIQYSCYRSSTDHHKSLHWPHLPCYCIFLMLSGPAR